MNRDAQLSVFELDPCDATFTGERQSLVLGRVGRNGQFDDLTRVKLAGSQEIDSAAADVSRDTALGADEQRHLDRISLSVSPFLRKHVQSAQYTQSSGEAHWGLGAATVSNSEHLRSIRKGQGPHMSQKQVTVAGRARGGMFTCRVSGAVTMRESSDCGGPR